MSFLAPKKTAYSDVTSSSDLSKLKLEHRLGIYDEMIEKFGAAREKIEHRVIIKSMRVTIGNLIEEIKKLKESEAKLKARKIDGPSNHYETFADAVKNKKKENIVIVKKTTKSNLKLKTDVFKKLTEIKDQVSVKPVRIREDMMVLKAESEEQRKIIIDKLSEAKEYESGVPKTALPSILIKEIQRIDELCDESVIDYSKYVKDELAEHLGLTEPRVIDNVITVKSIIDKPNYRTVRAIVNLNEKYTLEVLRNDYVKIGFSACPIERSVPLIQCRRCWKYGHFEYDKDGNLTCTAEHQVCPFCAESHPEDQCPIKKEKEHSKTKCTLCKGQHTAFSHKCPIRSNEIKRKLNRCH